MERRAPDLGCEEVQRLLWPLDRPRAHDDREEEARLHLEGCPACQEFFRRDREVEALLRSQGGRVQAPVELRERVYDALARERALAAALPQRRRLPGGRSVVVAAAAAVVGTLATAWWLDEPTQIPNAYAEDFASRVVEENVIATSDPVAVTRFFMKEMGMSLDPVPWEGARLSRAMICLIRGERAAMVEYDWQGHTVAHYRLPLEPGAEPARSTGGVHVEAARGVHVVRWAEEGFEHALVSDLPADRLIQLARRRFAGI